MSRLALFLALALLPAAASATPRWAVYVYMGADYADVRGPSLDDLEEMERVGSTADVKLVVQRDGARGAGMRRYLLERATGPAARRPSTPPLETHPEVDSGSARALEGFLDWALPRFPAKRRALVLAGHSWGWKGIIQDEQHGSIIPVPAVARAVQAAQVRHGVGAFDLVVVDACVAGSVEVAHELARVARVGVFTPIEEPYAGFPWDRVLAKLAADPAQDARALGRTMVEEFVTAYGPAGVNQSGVFEPVAAVAVDLAKVGALAAPMARLGAALAQVGEGPDRLERLAALSGPDRMLDVHELAHELAARPGAVGEAARAVSSALAYPAPDAAHGELVLERPRPFAVQIEVPVDARRAPKPGPIALHENATPAEHGRPGRVGLLRELKRLNPGLTLDRLEDARTTRTGTRVALAFAVRSEPHGSAHRVVLRPGVGTSSGCTWQIGADGGQVAWPERSVLSRFPPASPLIAEAHSTGTYPCHGLTVCFASEIPPDHVVHGPQDYRRLAWDADTHWSRFLFHPAR